MEEANLPPSPTPSEQLHPDFIGEFFVFEFLREIIFSQVSRYHLYQVLKVFGSKLRDWFLSIIINFYMSGCGLLNKTVPLACKICEESGLSSKNICKGPGWGNRYIVF